MMTMIVMAMMRLLNGTRVTKNAGPESKNKRGIFTHCLASIKMVGLVCS